MSEERPTVTTRDCDIDPVTRYVDILLFRMTQDNRQEATLSRSKPLPDPFIPRAGQLPEEIVYGAVVERLRAMTHGHNPNAEYTARSRCEVKFSGIPYELAVDVQEASCTVRLTGRE